MTNPATDQHDRDLLEDMQIRDDSADHLGEDTDTPTPKEHETR